MKKKNGFYSATGEVIATPGGTLLEELTIADQGFWAPDGMVAFGTPSKNLVKTFASGPAQCDAATFGGDPAPGEQKKCYKIGSSSNIKNLFVRDPSVVPGKSGLPMFNQTPTAFTPIPGALYTAPPDSGFAPKQTEAGMSTNAKIGFATGGVVVLVLAIWGIKKLVS